MLVCTVTSVVCRCDGATPELVFDFLADHGLPSAQCYPYQQGQEGLEGNTVSSCSTACDHENVRVKHHVKVSGEADMMLAIWNGGPIFTEINIDDEFLHYKSNIFSSTGSSAQVGSVNMSLDGAFLEMAFPESYCIS